ncbi:MAG: SET domain-containing protein [Saprospiraceae bacterium]|nr:SET domain-containing protein [Saprospiraceae bacterium]MBK6478930.1 SET domain-containing protein [Saprospiraceae bacterium]MBK7605775.1 SET domain-containing protein [Saprospiraceae bacterium]MBK8513618.1 SET domain-containing protein [Saprospiraceae bacterium]MBK8778968.1 SET domain-containing protein [Saprospiraceae bacterium]
MKLKQGESKFEILSHHGLGDIYFDHSTQQRSFVATRDITAGEILYQFNPKQMQSNPTYLTVQIGEESHIVLDPEFLASINHSCDPNVFFDVDHWVLRCVRDIKAGEQMTYFYPSTEWHMIQPFDCRCGSHNCLGYIQGADSINPEILSQYHVSSFIQQQIKTVPTLI